MALELAVMCRELVLVWFKEISQLFSGRTEDGDGRPKTKLRVLERKALRTIYGPTKESDGTWRIKSNEELNRLICNKNIINYIKAQRLAWFGHVHRMPDNSMVKKVYEWSPALTRSLGRPKNKWEDDVKSDITNMKITNWRDCIRNRPKWKEFVEKAKTSLKL